MQHILVTVVVILLATYIAVFISVILEEDNIQESTMKSFYKNEECLEPVIPLSEFKKLSSETQTKLVESICK